MKRYRICCLDSQGHISLAYEALCADDLDALDDAEQHCATGDVEVWDGNRLVARVVAKTAPLTAQDMRSA